MKKIEIAKYVHVKYSSSGQTQYLELRLNGIDKKKIQKIRTIYNRMDFDEIVEIINQHYPEKYI